MTSPLQEPTFLILAALAEEPMHGYGVIQEVAALSDGRVTLRIRYRFIGDLSPAVTAVVDPARLTWVEESVHDLDGLSVAVTLRPDHYADRLRCTGTYRYRSRGDRAERRISGELRVKALLVAGAVERAIISGLEEHLAAEVAAVERYLAR